jgi:thiamine biosynthesis protein ThiS
MSKLLTIQLNGQPRTLTEVPSPAQLYQLVQALGLKSDRIAIELNGEIVPRSTWTQTAVSDGDRLEIVHFVGGGAHSDGAV